MVDSRCSCAGSLTKITLTNLVYLAVNIKGIALACTQLLVKLSFLSILLSNFNLCNYRTAALSLNDISSVSNIFLADTHYSIIRTKAPKHSVKMLLSIYQPLNYSLGGKPSNGILESTISKYIYI